MLIIFYNGMFAFIGNASNVCVTLTLFLELELKKKTLEREKILISSVNIKQIVI